MSACGNRASKIWRMWVFEVFPHVTQITCGGGPKRASRSGKSRSFVMTTTPAARAASKIAVERITQPQVTHRLGGYAEALR